MAGAPWKRSRNLMGFRGTLLVVAGLSILLSPLQVWSSSSQAPCPQVVDTLKGLARSVPERSRILLGKEGLEHYQSLRTSKFAERFPEGEIQKLSNGSEIRVARMSAQEVNRFASDVSMVLEYRGRFEKIELKPFRKWLQEKHGGKIPVPSAFELEQKYKANGYTIAEYVDELYLTYLGDTIKDPSRLARATENFLRLPGTAASVDAVGRFAGRSWKYAVGLATGALILGPGVQITNSSFTVITEPITQFANQMSNRHLGWAGKEIQKVIIYSNGATPVEEAKAQKQLAEYQQARNELEKTTADLESRRFGELSVAEQKRLWKQFEERYYELALRVNQTLQPNLNTGRGIMKEWLLDYPLKYANNIATHDVEFQVHRSAIEALEEKIAAQGSPPTQEQLERLEEHGLKREFARKAIASNLAAWTVFRFVYPEINTPGGKEANGAEKKLTNSFSNLTEYMGFQLFANEVAKEMRHALKALDKQLVVLTKGIPD